jgi:hypothetical protein
LNRLYSVASAAVGLVVVYRAMRQQHATAANNPPTQQAIQFVFDSTLSPERHCKRGEKEEMEK